MTGYEIYKDGKATGKCFKDPGEAERHAGYLNDIPNDSNYEVEPFECDW